MAYCTKCGHQLPPDARVCPFCGNNVVRRNPTIATKPREYTPPPPYVWASDSLPGAKPPVQVTSLTTTPQYSPPLAHIGYQCPRCHSQTPPMVESRISTAGWIVFVVLLFLCPPLFWIGFFIKEDYSICPMCKCQLS